MTPPTLQSISGVLLGTAVGDALGLPREGLSRRRGRRMFGGPPLHHQFVFGLGMVSDDTEHTCMTAQALLRSPRDARGFARRLGWNLRFWLLGLPAGVGLATARAIGKLWLGFSPEGSGVWSAGNGPCMRAAILGVCLGDDLNRLRNYIHASTRLTHTDPRAERGAMLIALAAHHGARQGPAAIHADQFLSLARSILVDADDELLNLLTLLEKHLLTGQSAEQFALDLGLVRGVSGYVYHTVILALACWLRHPGDFRTAVEEVIFLGGDTDTTAAIVGGITGATVGVQNIPSNWIARLIDWPRSVTWIQRLADRLENQFQNPGNNSQPGHQTLFWPGVLVRNLLFLGFVLIHGFRRLFPPY